MKFRVEMRVEAESVDEAADLVAGILTAADADSSVVTDVVTRGRGFHPVLGLRADE